ncbi:hypothetical protein AMR72_11420 [Flavobacterium psychrophilum]|nr:hypothetical protein AMR72_11420 [Flavobacterium psychrophilum]AOE53071.1 hypothetical protein ALW18_11410 [Flavobacterium psychrophilum]
MKISDFYENRFLSRFENISLSDFFNDDVEEKTLIEYVNDYDKIVLLGEPGIGKTTELKNLFGKLWESKDKTLLLPFFINLKNYRSNYKIEDLIPYQNWRDLHSIIFIFDGLDEISEIHSFISDLEIFITKYKSLRLKFVISCRTNIYDKYIIKSIKFEPLFLRKLTLDQALNILQNQFDLKLTFSRFDNNYTYLENPFFLGIFAKFYKLNGKLPESNAEMWDLYINSTLEEHKVKQIKKYTLNIPETKKDLKKVAFVNELMQQNYLTEEELNKILGEKHLDFLENPLITPLQNSKNWTFKHRQIQEYFVASALTNKSFDEILSIIKIENTNSIHPSLFNSISFLINLFKNDDPEFEKLISWLITNQIEVLFKMDKDRLTNYLRIQVFQKYFQTQCIENTFWITQNKNIFAEEVAKFGNCSENFQYLTAVVSNKTSHFRAIISAYELMSHMDIPKTLCQELKENLIIQLNDDNLEINILSQILTFIKLQNLHLDSNYLHLIFKTLSNNDDASIANNLESLLLDYENIDEMFEFIKSEFLKLNNITNREKINHIYSSQKLSEELILKLKNPDHFLEIIRYYFDYQYSSKFDFEFSEKIYLKCIKFIDDNQDFIIKLIDLVKNGFKYSLNETPLAKIINGSSTNFIVAKHIFRELDFNDIMFFLASIANDEIIEFLVENIDLKTVESKDVEIFRNYIGNINNRTLAAKFDSLMQLKGFKFNEVVSTESDIILLRENFQKKIQENFDILFKKDELVQEINKIFTLYKTKVINRNIVYQIDSEWYEKNGHWNTAIDSSIKLLHTFIRKSNIVNLKDLEDLLKDDYVMVSELANQLDNHAKNSSELKISSEQKKYIEEWTKFTSNNFDFEKVQYQNQSYKKLKTIYLFTKKFDIELSNDFLVKSVKFSDIEIDGENIFELIKSKLDISDLKHIIVKNMHESNLSFSSTINHFNYSVDNKIEETYDIIKKYFLEDEWTFNDETTLSKFIDSSKDTDFLKDCCQDINMSICWSAIKIMIRKEIESDFIIDKALEYLNGRHEYYITNSLDVLSKFNHAELIKYIMKFLHDDRLYLNEEYFSSYNNIEGINYLKKLYLIIFSRHDDVFAYHKIRNFYHSYIYNLSALNPKIFSDVQNILYQIKSLLLKKEEDLFYINNLMEKSKESFINSLSKPLNFKSALKRTLQLDL